jgi:uncharacterized delta-60 repeat protein
MGGSTCNSPWRSTTHAVVGSLLACVLVLSGPGSVWAAGGDLDPTFSDDGRVTTSFVADAVIGRAVIILSDGSIVVVGCRLGSPCDHLGRFKIVRYGPDGSLDKTFGGDGRVTVRFRGGAAATAVALQPDGKLVVAGSARGGRSYALVRLDPDGSLDPTFGGDGRVTTNTFDGPSATTAFAVAVRSDGKIVAAGDWAVDALHGQSLARYHPDGSLDRTFDDDGKVVTRFGASSSAVANDIGLLPDGRIVTAGGVNKDAGGRFSFARYLPGGSLDASFGSDGKVVAHLGGESFDSTAWDLAVQSDGRVVAAGQLLAHTASAGEFGLVRLDQAGSLDPTFGGDGRVRTSFKGSIANAYGIALQSDGKIVVVGDRITTEVFTVTFALARYRSNGSLDPSFGGDGRISTAFGMRPATATDVAIQPDGRIVAAGDVFPLEGGSVFAVARYLPT